MLSKQHFGDVLTFPQISPIWSSMRNCARESNSWFCRTRKNYVRARKIVKLRARRTRAARGLMSSPGNSPFTPDQIQKSSRLWTNYQCTGIYSGLWTSAQYKVPAEIRTRADSTLRVESQRSNQFGRRVRPARQRLARLSHSEIIATQGCWCPLSGCHSFVWLALMSIRKRVSVWQLGIDLR